MTDIVERLREWSAADMDTHASLRRNGERVAVVPWSRHGTDLAETVLDAAAEIERLRAAQAAIREWCADAQENDPDAGYICAAEHAVALLAPDAPA